MLTRLGAYDCAAPAATTVRAPSGVWLSVQGARLREPEEGWTTVVIGPAGPATLMPLIISGLGLTRREAEVCQRLVAGLSRKSIAAELRISLHTVNDYVKSVFDKTDASSAGQLRTRLFADSLGPR